MKRRTQRWRSGCTRGLICSMILLAPLAHAEQLPIFKLSSEPVTEARGAALLTAATGGRIKQDIQTIDRAGALVQTLGDKQLEIEKASGGVFMRDTARLWNTELEPKLPSQEEARKIADRFIIGNKLLPSNDKYVVAGFSGYSETAISPDSGDVTEKTQLDVQVNYSVQLAIPRESGRTDRVPVVGGGGDFKVAIGEGGELIGYTGVWRPIVGVETLAEIIPQSEAEERYRKSLGEMKVIKIASELAYYSAPSFEKQELLTPVWVMRGEAEVADQRIPLRMTIIAATQYGPVWRAPQPMPRDQAQRPNDWSLDGDEQVSNGSLLDWLIGPAHAASGFEGGTSWIGPSQGLSGSPANAQGFVDGLASAGWDINFNWGEWTAFESDWNASDDSWVDAADFVFYTGHANSDGWVLNIPNDTFLSFSEVGGWPGSPNDRWGQNDLEWIIIAACGPHQSSHFVGGVGNAFDRWRAALDGLHVFMGYGAVTYDNTTEGSRVVQLAQAGWTVIDAWFRAAWEIQPSTNGNGAPNGPNILVTAMYAEKPGIDTRNDRIWGTGTTVPDAREPGQIRWLLWSGT
jgi:hypothetical protein